MSAIYRNYLLRRDLARLVGLLSAPFVRYVSAGGVGTGVHYATLALCVELSRLSPTWATIVGALAGASVNYLLNYHFTFASNASHRVTLPRFFVVAGISAALNGAGMWYGLQHLHFHYLLAQMACTGGVLVIGYLFNREWTFRAGAVKDGKPDSMPPA